MLTDQKTTVAIQALIGNVEWIYQIIKPGLHTGLDLVFRVNGELKGLTVYLHEPGVSCGPRGRENRYPGASSLALEELDRERLLTATTYLEGRHGALLTDVERAEWDSIVARDEAEMKRRQFEELKKELGENR